MNIEDLIPGLKDFDKKPYVQPPDGFSHEREAWELGDFAPDTYIDEDGTRHIVVFGGDLLPEKLTLTKHWQVGKELF